MTSARAARIAWARSRAMQVIPRVAARRPFSDLLQDATREQLYALIAVLADRDTLEKAAHAEAVRASGNGRPLPDSVAALARDWERKRGARRRAANPEPAGLLAQIRSDEARRASRAA